MEELIRKILADHGRIKTDLGVIGDDDDLYRVGLTSHASVNVMLALEDTFDIEFPDAMLKKSTFESIGAIQRALQVLDATVPAE